MTIIVVTPIKNEAWILPRFLSVTSQFADVIIVADQQSTDGSREICQQFSKVQLIENVNTEFNEPERQKLLLDAARQYPEPRVILALDADEIVSSTILNSPEWQTMLTSAPGTVIQFSLVELWGSTLFYRVNNNHGILDQRTIGYIDDGADHVGRQIHSERIPVSTTSDRLRLQDVVIMHSATLSFARFQSKNRWYRCYEHAYVDNRSSLSVNRFYDQYWNNMQNHPTCEVPSRWIDAWVHQEIDMTSINETKYYWWDWEVLRMIEKFGVNKFRYLDIWSFNWEQARLDGLTMGIEGLPSKPISVPQKFWKRFLLRVQKQSQSKFYQRLVDIFLSHLMTK